LTIDIAYQNLAQESPETDFLIISRTIDRSLHADLTRCLEQHSAKNKNCHVFLTTYGGDPHGGYRVARCLRHHYSKIKVIVPSYCKSAGTMIAIAADQLAIGDLGELGPLDVQVIKPNEMQERGSGLDIMQAMNACLTHAQDVFEQNFVRMRQILRLSSKQAGEFAARIASEIVAPMYEQIEPLRIGELQRALAITLEYGERLNTHSSNLKRGALKKLVSGYPAHGFVIDRKEAKDLFVSVLPLSSAEKNLCSILWEKLRHESQTGPLLLGSSKEGVKNGNATGQKDTRAATKTVTPRASAPRPASRNTKRPNSQKPTTR
jgi:hypothetical protein